MRLADLGWDDGFAGAFAALSAPADVRPARVVIEFNYLYRVWAEDGEQEATASGRLKHHATSRSQMPAVGDWVALRKRPDQVMCPTTVPIRPASPVTATAIVTARETSAWHG